MGDTLVRNALAKLRAAGFRADHYFATAVWAVICIGGSIYAHTPAFLLLMVPLSLIYVVQLLP